jgi:hypothetical protein
MSNKLLVLTLLLCGATAFGTAQGQEDFASSVTAQAAKYQFRSDKRCLEVALRIEATTNVNQICKSSGNRSAQGERCSDAKMAMRSNRILTTQKEQAGCSTDPIVLERNYHSALVKAAQTGDPDVEVCYISGWSPLDPTERAAYIKNSEVFIKKGLARGDWRVVELLSRPLADGGVGIMINLPNMGSHFTTYRFNRLLQLGAVGNYADIARVTAEDERRFLTKAQVINANEWAREEYRKYFSHSPKLTAAPVPCLSTISGD